MLVLVVRVQVHRFTRVDSASLVHEHFPEPPEYSLSPIRDQISGSSISISFFGHWTSEQFSAACGRFRHSGGVEQVA